MSPKPSGKPFEIQLDIWRSNLRVTDKVMLAMIDALKGDAFPVQTASKRTGISKNTIKEYLNRYKLLGFINDTGQNERGEVKYVLNYAAIKAYVPEWLSEKKATPRPPAHKELQNTPSKALVRALCGVWQREMGGGLPWGRVAKAIRPIFGLFADDELVIAWKRYIRTGNKKMLSIEHFATRPKLFMEPQENIPSKHDALSDDELKALSLQAWYDRRARNELDCNGPRERRDASAPSACSQKGCKE